MTLKDIFKENIIKSRNEKGITQEKLAEMTGFHQTYISDLERGIRNPSLLTIEKIAKSLEIPAYKLLMGKKKK